MGVLNKLGDLFGKNLIDGVANAADRFITTGEDKRQFRLEVERLMALERQQVEVQITERHKNDMLADSWLSKNIRPLTLLILMVIFIIIVVASIYDKAIDPIVSTAVTSTIGTVLGFYFGNRDAQKQSAQILESINKKSGK